MPNLAELTRLSEAAQSNVPEITLIFWIIKVAATTLGETGTGIFGAILVVTVIAQFRSLLYGTTITISTCGRRLFY
jgi:uncharacterized membrane-anchored protein